MADYPAQLEEWVETQHGIRIFIRPIRHTDGPKLKAFFYTLSPETVYNRFLTPIKEVTDQQVQPFVMIDYENHMAFAALDKEDGNILGVARCIKRNEHDADIAVVVTDSWQGKGIGTLLLKRLCTWGKQHGIERFYSVVDPQNIKLLKFANSLGFKSHKTYEDGLLYIVCSITEE